MLREKQRTIGEAQARLAENEARRVKLQHQLNRSIMLQCHFPDAFEHGRARSRVVGNAHRPSELRFVLTRGDGSERECKALDVPPICWCGALRAMLETPNLSPVARTRYTRLLASVTR